MIPAILFVLLIVGFGVCVIFVPYEEPQEKDKPW
jgi:hypothetical protein